MEERTVAILMATYNGEQFLAQQLNSILTQTYKNWVLLVHDDGSEDGTVDILEEYSIKYPEKVIFINDGLKLGNAKDNFSHLIGIALEKDFEYFFFCDQDDIWIENKIEIFLQKFKQIENLREDLPILLHSDLRVVDSNLDVISDSMWRYQKLNPECKTLNYLLVQNNVTGCACAVNRALLKKAYPIGGKAIMHDWWLALVASAFGVVDFISKPTVLYRQHGKNDTGAKNVDVKYAVKKCTRKDDLVKSITKTILQAQNFLSTYEDCLKPEQRDMLRAYVQIPYVSYIGKLLTIFRFKLFKQNFLRNLGFLWYLRYVREDLYDICNNSNI
ncbi:glycosyltransferase family 2 protein [Desulfurobacterium sp. TC5-1]|uniref:glycosyltransferase family 2 protein n=1 Tax=Desulfurobacterium sp. TC5-1 TaxID=1158318 RepID=UPI0003B5FA94|nr:glycosyltransferase family 2 protein [Desulfurobacterium sp. TC5-1]